VKILVAESQGFPAEALRVLRSAGPVSLEDLDPQGLRAALQAQNPDALWIRLRTYLDSSLMDRAPNLRIVATPTPGLTHIDLDALADRGITLVSLRGETDFLRQIRATAEHTIGLMLALLRHTPDAAAHARAGGWDRDQFIGRELHGKTVGIIGLGRLGSIVARYLQAFDCRVLAADPRPVEAPGVEVLSLEALLEAADLISLHASLDRENHGLVDARCFARMKPGAVFINTARGELVDEQALLAALESERLSGAALDVLTGEDSAGMARHPLVAFAQRNPRRLLLTPHVGGATVESKENTEVFLARKLAAVIEAALEPQQECAPCR
jgi:D-3-phosphoglycerate dehydrogenase